MSVAEPGDAEGGGEIEESVAVGIPDVHAFGAIPEDRPARGDAGNVAGLIKAKARCEGEGSRAGDGSTDVREHWSIGADELAVEFVVGAVEVEEGVVGAALDDAAIA